MDIVQKIETLLGRQALENLDFEALELAARKQVLQLAAKAIEQRLNADTSDEGGAHLRCRCGAAAKLIGRRSKTFHSVLARCGCSVLIITVPLAVTATFLAIDSWAWRKAPCLPPLRA